MAQSSSGHDNVSASTEELEEYMHASKVNVSNFVVKLSGQSNYHIWKAQMLSLLDKLMIRDIVENRDAWLKSKSKDIAKKYDILLKGWILGSLDEELLRHFDSSDDAQSIWWILENYHGHISASKEELEEYKHASNVNVSNFVSVKLSGQSNYLIWKAQMLSLLDKLMIRDIVESCGDRLKSKSYDIAKKYDILLKGWILGSLNEEVLKHFDLRLIQEHGKFIYSDYYPTEVPVQENKRNTKYHWYSTEVECIWAKLADEYCFRGGPTEKVRIRIPAEDDDNNARLGELRNATREGNWWRAQSILRKYEFEITKRINDVDDTMLHLAVGEGKNYFVQRLLNSNEQLIEMINNKGQTALHIAAMFGNKYAAELLVKKRENLLYVGDKLGEVPLLIAYKSYQISTFAYLFEATKTPGELLSKDSFEQFIIRLIYRKEYGLAFQLYEKHLKSIEKQRTDKKQTDKEQQTDKDQPTDKEQKTDKDQPTDKVLMAITRNFPSDFGIGEALIYPSLENACENIVKRSSLLFYSIDYLCARAEHTLWRMKRFKNNYYSWLLPEIVMLLLVPVAVVYPLYQLILLFISVLLLPFYMLYSLLWKVLATVVAPIKDIEKRKKEYEEAKHFLHNTVNHIDSLKLDNSRFYKFIALEAVRLDVYEVLHLIISHFKETIEYTNERHNIIQLAVIHRSEKVYNRIFYPLIKQKETYRELKDYSGNNLLHLVGRLAPSYVLSRTTGAALQIQQELQWYEEVKKFMEPMQLTERNIDDETPDEVFSREHENLVKEGQKWMKATAESSSITAALIVTIVFAAAITVPGGSNQETGKPLFKKQIAFTVFAVSDAISLFSASTSLIVFLSILTTRFAEKDFLHRLPRRLLIALFLLILSTSSMMLAFSAILFLVFCDQRPWMLAPIGVFTCVPIAAIVYLQLPLVVNLYQSTYSSMFGKRKLHYSQL